jgi:anti-sigma B factor antagonist
MATALAVHTDNTPDGSPRVIASGEIDLSNIDVFARALRSVNAVTVDLSAVKYLDSAAINTLFDHAGDVDRMRLIVHPFLIPVLSISGLGDIATIEPASDGRADVADG